jgi:hypothetical protein
VQNAPVFYLLPVFYSFSSSRKNTKIKNVTNAEEITEPFLLIRFLIILRVVGLCCSGQSALTDVCGHTAMKKRLIYCIAELLLASQESLYFKELGYGWWQLQVARLREKNQEEPQSG